MKKNYNSEIISRTIKTKFSGEIFSVWRIFWGTLFLGGEFSRETILQGLFSKKDFLGHLIAANNFMENFNLCFT